MTWWEGVEKGQPAVEMGEEQLGDNCRNMGFADTMATAGKERSSQCFGSGPSCLLHLEVSQVSISLKLTWFGELVVSLPVEGCTAVQLICG